MEAEDTEGERPGTFAAFASRDFRLLWGGQTISFVGDAAFVIAVGWRVTALTKSPGALGFVLAAESVAIAIAGTDDTSRLIAERCTMLGITNIRVIKRIRRFVETIKKMLVPAFDDEVFETAVASIALFSWSHDQPEEAPPLAFLKDKTLDKFGLRSNEDMSGQQAAWNSLLEAYGYVWTDDFDLPVDGPPPRHPARAGAARRAAAIGIRPAG